MDNVLGPLLLYLTKNHLETIMWQPSVSHRGLYILPVDRIFPLSLSEQGQLHCLSGIIDFSPLCGWAVEAGSLTRLLCSSSLGCSCHWAPSHFASHQRYQLGYSITQTTWLANWPSPIDWLCSITLALIKVWSMPDQAFSPLKLDLYYYTDNRSYHHQWGHMGPLVHEQKEECYKKEKDKESRKHESHFQQNMVYFHINLLVCVTHKTSA